jgi:hypothetical protein
MVLTACNRTKQAETPPTPAKLSKIGISLNIPKNFEPLPPEELEDIGKIGATIVPAEPFKVIPQYSYREASDKGVLIISGLQFTGTPSLFL